jgi:Protein of unknown function (DUF3501)
MNLTEMRVPSISRESLMTLESYARQRGEFRARVIAHKRHRTVHVGPDVTLIFEDELTIRYQVQEMLRIERIFDEDGIRAELDAYTPLVPDGTNLKATMMIEFEDPQQRALELARLKGIERRVYVQVERQPKILAIADEDLQRENEQKTSAVHFLRFEFDRAVISALRQGAAVAVGIDHPSYSHRVDALAGEITASLAKDFA